MPVTTADKAATFPQDHDAAVFPLPNPFDVGSAKAPADLGFKALASTSAGLLPWTIGKAATASRSDVGHLTACAGGRSAGQRRFRRRLRAQAGEGRSPRRARGQDRGGRVVVEILPGDAAKTALRARLCENASRRRARPSMPTTAACC